MVASKNQPVRYMYLAALEFLLLCCIYVQVSSFSVVSSSRLTFGKTRRIKQIRTSPSPSSSSSSLLRNSYFDDDVVNKNVESVNKDDENDPNFTREVLEKLTMTKLKQQLRLRGLPVSGRKAELIDRLLQTKRSTVNAEILSKSKAREIAEKHGKELVDVSEFLDEKDKGKHMKSSAEDNNIDDDDDDGNSIRDRNPETWGKEAKIVDDYEGRSLVVDNLSRTLVEFPGSNNSHCQAYVAASRDALKPFLAGGATTQNTTAAEHRIREIQTKREAASRKPTRPTDVEEDGPDEGDEEGLYKSVINRDYTDWGVYTSTGAQLSAQEIPGVVLLSDVFGPFTNQTRALADRIAFECQPVVVMAPDVFRGQPWEEVDDTGRNEQGQDYEEWRAQHSDLRVSVDIRAAAACLRQRYGVSSVSVWGTCYGGGRALEVASGWAPNRTVHDVDGKIAPPPVNPMAVVSWYPTRYSAKKLFGKKHIGAKKDLEGRPKNFAVMAVFAEGDGLPGATPDDAASLQQRLEDDDRVKDVMVKIFPGQVHGFAHKDLGKEPDEDEKSEAEKLVDGEFGGSGRVDIGSSDADVAFLLSTAWMETYSRVFLPTVGRSVREDGGKWNDLIMPDLSEAYTRDIRREIEDALDNYSPPKNDFDDLTEEQHEERTKRILMSYQDGKDPGKYTIRKEDSIDEMLEKLKAWDSNLELF